MSDLSSSDIETLKEIEKKPKSKDSIPDPESSSPEEVDSPDEITLEDAPSVNVSEKEQEEEDKKEEKETKTIKSIMNHRAKAGRIQYLVKYNHSKKFPNEWVDEDDLIDYVDLITKYMQTDTSKPPEKKKVDLSNLKFEIIGAFKKKEKIYYQLRYENGETTLISSKKMHALDSSKLIKFLEKYCISENKIV